MLVRWRILQTMGMVVTLALLGGLIVQPDYTLSLFWSVFIPILPATFLVSPLIWRGACPMATVNMMTGSVTSSRQRSLHNVEGASLLSVSCFALLVPARLFVFNENALALALSMVLVLMAAGFLGTRYRLRAGFCNSICPVLPIEKLYGSHPIVQIKNTRCAACSLCTAKGCIDVSPSKSITKVLGKRLHSRTWIFSPMGIFALCLPGFVSGYFMTPEGPWNEALSIYTQIALWALSAYMLFAGIVLALSLSPTTALPLLGSLAAGLYYWFVVPDTVGFLGGPDVLIAILRSAALGLILLWLLQLHSQQRRPGIGSRRQPQQERGTF